MVDQEYEHSVYSDFTQVCYECDPPSSVSFMNGQRVPSKCGHDLPGITVEIN